MGADAWDGCWWPAEYETRWREPDPPDDWVVPDDGGELPPWDEAWGPSPAYDGGPSIGASDRRVDAMFSHEDELDVVVRVSATIGRHVADRLVAVARLRAVMWERFPPSTSVGIRERSIRLELSSALRITEHAAEDLLGFADAVVHAYPVVLDAIWSAAITEHHAKILVGGVDSVDPSLREVVLQRGLELAKTEPVGVFRRKLREMIETLRERTLTERHEQAVDGRRVVLEPAADGMAWLLLHIPAVEAHALWDRVTRMGKHLQTQPDEPRTLDQLRADILCDLGIDGTAAGHPQGARGIRAQVVVTVPVLALLDPEATGVPDGCDPASVEGIGPVPLPVARELCAAASGWMRVLTHPETGIVLSVGRERYQPPPELARLVKWRAGRCMAPGCGLPAARCQIDHNIAWNDGGVTALWNNAPFCQGHHTIKHDGLWSIVQLDGGAIQWTSPLGRTYTVQPERRVPTFTPKKETQPAPF